MSLTSPVRILIGCRDPDFGGALASFAEVDGIHVIAIADSMAALTTNHATADVIVAVDPSVFLPERVVEAVGTAPVLIIGPAIDPTQMIASVEAGALGYVDVEAPLADLISAIRSVAGGVSLIPPMMLGSLLRHVVDRRRLQRQKRERLQVLTTREFEVFELSVRGLDRNQVAARLFISPGTARTHIQNIFRKLGAHSLADLVAMAADCGLDVGRPEDSRND